MPTMRPLPVHLCPGLSLLCNTANELPDWHRCPICVRVVHALPSQLPAQHPPVRDEPADTHADVCVQLEDLLRCCAQFVWLAVERREHSMRLRLDRDDTRTLRHRLHRVLDLVQLPLRAVRHIVSIILGSEH